MMMMHHAFVIEAGREEGVALARAWVSEHIGSDVEVVPLQHGLLSVEDARRVVEVAGQTSAEATHRIIIISAERAYHEAQNALLKVFEEPPPGAILFLVLPSLGGLLPTLRSRAQEISTKSEVLKSENRKQKAENTAEAFLKTSREERSVLIKKLASGKDDDERREHREEAIALVNGIERVAYDAMQSRRLQSGLRPQASEKGCEELRALLSDISVLREHLYDRSAPVKMILEHLSIVVPKNLV